MSTSETHTHHDSLTLDELFDCLGHGTRRHVVVTIAEDSPRPLSDFDPPEGVPAARFRQSLHHNHLPRLAESAVVEWNPETGVIRRGDRFDGVRSVLDLLQNHEDQLPVAWS